MIEQALDNQPRNTGELVVPLERIVPTMAVAKSVSEVADSAIAPLLEHRRVEFFSEEGVRLATRSFCFVKTSREVAKEYLPYRVVDGKLLIVACQELQPGLCGRADLKSGVGRIFMAAKAPVVGEFANLGGAFEPSVGSSGAKMQLLARECPELGSGELVDAQEIVNEYFKDPQGAVSLGILLGVFRLAEQVGVSLSVPISLHRAELPSDAEMRFPVLHGAELRSRVENPTETTHESQVARVQISHMVPPPKPFLKVREVNTSIQDQNGEAVEEKLISMIARPSLDAVDVAAYWVQDGEVCTVVKRCIRPAQMFADGEGIFDRARFTIGGISESLEKNDNSLDAIRLRAEAGVREEAGVEPAASGTFIGSLYPSPGDQLERVYNFLVQIDPSQKSTAECGIDERVDLFGGPVKEILQLCKEGRITDPRVELNARILLAAS